MQFSIPIDSPSRQQGAALFMALIILLVLTILGVFGMNISRLENLMAGNAQFQTTALNNAEYTLARGIEDVQDVASSGLAFPAGGAGLPYHDISEAVVQPDSLNWVDSSSNPIFNFKAISLPDTNGDGADGTGKYVIVNAGVVNNEGESFAYVDVTNPPPGGSVQSFVITAQSDSARGAKRTVQSVVVTDPLIP